MDKKISSGLKTTFLVHIVIGLIFGLVNLLYPRLWNNLGVPMADPEMTRLVGAAILAFTASSWWAYKETSFERVKIIVQAEIVWTILATLVLLFGLIFAGLPTLQWMNAIIMAAFAAAFSYFYSRA